MKNLVRMGDSVFDPDDILAIRFAVEDNRVKGAKCFLAVADSDGKMTEIDLAEAHAVIVHQRIRGNSEPKIELTMLQLWGIDKRRIVFAQRVAEKLRLLFDYGGRFPAWVELSEEDDIYKFMGPSD